MASRRPSTPPECAVCGADIPPRASACPNCGADERTGWAEQDIYDGLDLPEDDESSEASRSDHQRTTGMTGQGPRGALGWLWWAVTVGLLVVLVLGWVLGIGL